jgi:hypothetical protein
MYKELKGRDDVEDIDLLDSDADDGSCYDDPLCVEYVSLLVKFKLQLLYPRDIKF